MKKILVHIAAFICSTYCYAERMMVVEQNNGQKSYYPVSSVDRVTVGGMNYCTVSGVLGTQEYVDLGLPSSLIWATTNVGAQSATDGGDYYAYGEVEPKTDYSVATYKWCKYESLKYLTKYVSSITWSATNSPDYKKYLEASDDIATVKLGADWYMPTYWQICELRDGCTWSYSPDYMMSGVAGWLGVSKYNGNTIFFPAAGFMSGTTKYTYLTYTGSSEQMGQTREVLKFNSSGVAPQDIDRNYGVTVRGVSRVVPKCAKKDGIIHVSDLEKIYSKNIVLCTYDNHLNDIGKTQPKQLADSNLVMYNIGSTITYIVNKTGGDIIADSLNYRSLNKYNNTLIESIVYEKARLDCTDLSFMFGNLANLKTIDCSGLKINSNVTRMDSMFYWCKTLKTLIFPKDLDTRNVKSMKNMFCDCRAITRLDLSQLNTSSVKNMSGMFKDCYMLDSLDLSSFNTANVEKMDSMFCYCDSLDSVNLSSFNTENVVSMKYMFYYCTSLKSLDLSSFNTSAVKNYNYMFVSCRNLETIYVSKNFVISADAYGEYVFAGSILKGGAGTTYSRDNVDLSYAIIDGGESNPGYFTEK